MKSFFNHCSFSYRIENNNRDNRQPKQNAVATFKWVEEKIKITEDFCHSTKFQNEKHVFSIFVPILSCQCFHSNSLTCCSNLASILHESLNWVFLFPMVAPEPGNMMWRTGKWKDDTTSQQWHLWLICQRLCEQWKAWLPHPHQHTPIHVKRYYPHASAGNNRCEVRPYLCKPLLLLCTKGGWRGVRVSTPRVKWTCKWHERV